MAQMNKKETRDGDHKDQIAYQLFAVSTTYTANRLICVLVTQSKPSRHTYPLVAHSKPSRHPGPCMAEVLARLAR
jgi:hypothetical protein